MIALLKRNELVGNTTSSDYILDFQRQEYPYMEEINEGILKQVKLHLPQGRILDIGAGRGLLGAAFKKLGHEVFVIESNTEAAEEAKMRVDQVICADLCNIQQIAGELKDLKFNALVFSDVLEHVYDPLAVLRSYLPYLEPDGRIFISLPNAVNWFNRISILMGKFEYEMTGVMDRTHLRFFTFRSAKRLVWAASCQIERVDSTPFLIRAFLPWIKSWMGWTNQKLGHASSKILQSPSYLHYQKWIYPMEYLLCRLAPSILSFRMIFVARKNLRELS